MLDLSLIIVSYKGWPSLERCLDSLKRWTGLPFSFEVIIVDNSGDPDFYEIEKKYPDFRYLHNSLNGGFSNGCNLGAGFSAGKYLLFINPDTIPVEEEVFKLLEGARKNPEFYIVTCNQVNGRGKTVRVTGFFPDIRNLTSIQRSIHRKFSEKKEEGHGNIVISDWVSGSILMIRKDIFQEIKGFDEDFWMYFEDTDICRRVRNIGGIVAFFRDISMVHSHGGSSRINLKVKSITKTEVFISQHVYFSKHKSGSEMVCIQVFLVISNLISCFLSAIAGLILFFIPALFVKFLIFIRLSRYYFGALMRRSWISPRSVNFLK